MKHNIIKYFFFVLTAFVAFSCKEDDKIAFAPVSSTAPVLADPKLETQYILEKKSGEDVFSSFSWSEAVFNVPTSVIYALEVGNENDKYTTIKLTKGLNTDVKINELNKSLKNIDIDTAIFNDITFRVSAFITDDADQPTRGQFVSNEKFKTKVDPYPSHLKLFLVTATDSYKVVDKESFIISNEANSEFIGSLALDSEESYKFKNNDFEDGTARFYALDASTGKFIIDGTKAITVAETGKYKIKTNTDTKIFEIEKAQPIIWVPGAHNGWSHDIKDVDESNIESYTNVNLVSAENNGIYTGKVWLIGEFKFTNAPNWNGINFGANDNKFSLDADSGAGNHSVDSYNGTGLYELRVDANSLTFEILSFEAAEVVLPENNALWVVGDHSGWRLNIRDILEEKVKDSGIYEGEVQLTRSFQLEVSPDAQTTTKVYRTPAIAEEGTTIVGGLIEGETNNYLMKVSERGLYKLRVDLNEMEYSLFSIPTSISILGAVAGVDPLAMNALDGKPGQFDAFTYFKPGKFKLVENTDRPDIYFGQGTEAGTIQLSGTEINAGIEGTVLVNVNFSALTYTIERPSVGVIGSATPGEWANDTDMTYITGENAWEIKGITLIAGEIKFRAMNDWAHNWGGDGAGNVNGDNIPITEAGTYDLKLTLDPVNGDTYSVTKK